MTGDEIGQILFYLRLYPQHAIYEGLLGLGCHPCRELGVKLLSVKRRGRQRGIHRIHLSGSGHLGIPSSRSGQFSRLLRLADISQHLDGLARVGDVGSGPSSRLGGSPRNGSQIHTIKDQPPLSGRPLIGINEGFRPLRKQERVVRLCEELGHDAPEVLKLLIERAVRIFVKIKDLVFEGVPARNRIQSFSLIGEVQHVAKGDEGPQQRLDSGAKEGDSAILGPVDRAVLVHDAHRLHDKADLGLQQFLPDLRLGKRIGGILPVQNHRRRQGVHVLGGSGLDVLFHLAGGRYSSVNLTESRVVGEYGIHMTAPSLLHRILQVGVEVVLGHARHPLLPLDQSVRKVCDVVIEHCHSKRNVVIQRRIAGAGLQRRKQVVEVRSLYRTEHKVKRLVTNRAGSRLRKKEGRLSH